MANNAYTTDTTPEAQQVQLELWKSMTGQQRVGKALALSQQLRAMAFAAIVRRHPEFDAAQVQLKFIELTYGAELAADFENWSKGQN